MTEEEYQTLARLAPDRKYEYINGVAYLMSGGSVAPDRIRRNITFALDTLLRDRSCSVFGPAVQVMIGLRKKSTPHSVDPDTTVSCDPGDRELDTLLVRHPRVVVEVLSAGTEAKDRGTKFKQYQLWPTMQERILVNQFAPHVQVWQRNEDDPDNVKAWLFRRYGPGDVIELARIHVQIAIEAFYRGWAFDDGGEEHADE
jgi:Uma2 family endonuclease